METKLEMTFKMQHVDDAWYLDVTEQLVTDEPPTMTLPQPALAAVSVAAQPDMRLTRPWPKSRSVGGKA